MWAVPRNRWASASFKRRALCSVRWMGSSVEYLRLGNMSVLPAPLIINYFFLMWRLLITKRYDCMVRFLVAKENTLRNLLWVKWLTVNLIPAWHDQKLTQTHMCMHRCPLSTSLNCKFDSEMRTTARPKAPHLFAWWLKGRGRGVRTLTFFLSASEYFSLARAVLTSLDLYISRSCSRWRKHGGAAGNSLSLLLSLYVSWFFHYLWWFLSLLWLS